LTTRKKTRWSPAFLIRRSPSCGCEAREKTIRKHLQNTIAASAARDLGVTEQMKISGEELLYWELTSFVGGASLAAFVLEDVIPALIRHAVELAGFYCEAGWKSCTPEEARELLIKTLDKYLFLEGLDAQIPKEPAV
jgi:hypothetical protein